MPLLLAGRKREVARPGKPFRSRTTGAARQITLSERGKATLQIPASDTGVCPAGTLAWLKSRWRVAGGKLPQIRVRQLRDRQDLRLRGSHRGERQDVRQPGSTAANTADRQGGEWPGRRRRIDGRHARRPGHPRRRQDGGPPPFSACTVTSARLSIVTPSRAGQVASSASQKSGRRDGRPFARMRAAQREIT